MIFGPYDVEIIPHLRVKVKGIEIDLKLWKPRIDKKFPCILEYIPYRKTDRMVVRDSKRHPWMSSQGYIMVRADIRGSGDSDGFLLGEYLKEELDDCVFLIDYLSKQSYCDGNVGMYGKSWGGFNGLQVAFLQPPALKSVISLYSTDDRYSDDVHYLGGCMMAADMVSWASYMFAWNCSPPLTNSNKKNWRENFSDRILGKGIEPWLDGWVENQTREEFWKHGSICEDFSRIQIPIYMIGGWRDCYKNAIFRTIQKNKYFKALLGPWSHEWPDEALPGPNIDFLGECKLFWDKTLKGIEREEDPSLRVYVRESMKPNGGIIEYWKGNFEEFDSWDDEKFEKTNFFLKPDGFLSPSYDTDDLNSINIESFHLNGIHSGAFLSFGEPDGPYNQRFDDSLSTSFTSEIYNCDTVLIGAPEVKVFITSNQPIANLICRLCEVYPNNDSTLICRGVLNLTHRDGHEKANIKELVPGKEYAVMIKLDYTAWKVAKGNKIRLCLSTDYFPLVWPSPLTTLLTLRLNKSFLALPIVNIDKEKKLSRDLGVPKVPCGLKKEFLRQPNYNRCVNHNLSNDVVQVIVECDSGRQQIEVVEEGLETIYDEFAKEIYTRGVSNISTKIQVERVMLISSIPLESCKQVSIEADDTWGVFVKVKTIMTCDEEYFYISHYLSCFIPSNDKVDYAKYIDEENKVQIIAETTFENPVHRPENFELYVAMKRQNKIKREML